MIMYIATEEGNVPMSIDEESAFVESQKEIDSSLKSMQISMLWQSATDYIYQYINGVGLSILSAGVVAGKPKAIAVAAWCDNVWKSYYVKKDNILNGSDVSFDFSDTGQIPYTVIELKEEIASMWSIV